MKTKILHFLLFFGNLLFECNAQTLFNKRIDGPNWTYPGSSIIRLDDGSLMVGSLPAVVKTDSTGEFIWARDYGTGHYKLVKGADGYIYVAGFHDTAGVDNDGMALSKIDTAGNLFWTKTYNFFRASYAGMMIESNDSNFIMVGGAVYYDSITGHRDSSKLIVIKSDYDGNPTWIKSFKFQNIIIAEPYDIITSTPGRYLIYGNVQTADSARGFLLEIDNNGTILNALTLNAGQRDGIVRIFMDKDLKLIEITNVLDLSPSTDLTILLSLDTNQSIKWANKYDEACHGGQFRGMIVGKHNHNYLINAGIQVAEIDTLGQLVFRYGILNNPTSIAYEYLTYLNDHDFIYYTGGENVTYDYLLVGKSDSTGYCGCSYTSAPLPCSIASINIYIHPSIIQADTFGVSLDSSFFLYIRPSATAYINCPYTGINEFIANNSYFNVYPNPAVDILHIDKRKDDNVSFTIYIVSILGQCAFKQILNSYNNIIELPKNMKTGLYLLTLMSKNEYFQYKLNIISSQ